MPQPTNKINVDDNNLAPHGELYLHPEKIIDHLLYSAEGKERFSIYRWVGIDTQKNVMHFPTCNVNLCVLCYNLFYSDVDIFFDMEDLIYTRFKRLKIRGETKICIFVWYTFL